MITKGKGGKGQAEFASSVTKVQLIPLMCDLFPNVDSEHLVKSLFTTPPSLPPPMSFLVFPANHEEL